jgi:tRNA modification GTPase
MHPPAADDTIVAIATPPGVGGIGVVRLSGPKVTTIAAAILGRLPPARRATLCGFHAADGALLDQGLALYFPAPHSYTGEAVLELHGHGGPVVLDQLLCRSLELGARQARAGEFSERAYLNGKLDLAQAEAVADLIGAASAQSARAALNSLQGRFSEHVRRLTDELVELRTRLEAALDFPEEGIEHDAVRALRTRANALADRFEPLLHDAHQGQLLHDGMTVVLAGRPNAGKSSLLNLLAQRDSAIVSPTPGTTRDVLRERIQIDGLPVRVLDTAGLRETRDTLEAEGVRRAYDAMQRADRVLLIVDDQTETEAGLGELLAGLPSGALVTVVRNKIDLTGRAPGPIEAGPHAPPEVALSATSAHGLEALHAHLKTCMGYQTAGEGSFSARRRHLDALQRARTGIRDAGHQLEHAQFELAAEHLRLAQRALGEITGQFTSDDLLGRIFASFCIGK